MTELTERNLAWGFGIAGAVLLFAGALVGFLLTVADLVLGHVMGAATDATGAVLLLVVGGLALFFAHLGHKGWSDRPLVSGLLLVVIGAVGLALLGLGVNIVGLIGALFVLLAGVLYLAGPIVRSVEHVATA